MPDTSNVDVPIARADRKGASVKVTASGQFGAVKVTRQVQAGLEDTPTEIKATAAYKDGEAVSISPDTILSQADETFVQVHLEGADVAGSKGQITFTGVLTFAGGQKGTATGTMDFTSGNAQVVDLMWWAELP